VDGKGRRVIVVVGEASGVRVVVGAFVGVTVEDTVADGVFGEGESATEVGISVDELGTLQAGISIPIRLRYKIILTDKRFMPTP
jgi:hypothetical protein